MSAPDGWRQVLSGVFRDAVAAVDGADAVRTAVVRVGTRVIVDDRVLPVSGRLWLLAVGKAAPSMARAFEGVVGDRLAGGLVVTTEAAASAAEASGLRSEIQVGAHPVPDARSATAADAVLRWVAALALDDTLCVLLSGGASSLLARPLEGLALDDLAATTDLLLRAGADIHELNTVRKHIAAAAGGRLAQACPAAQIELLAISDVSDDAIDVIGSGPLSADPTRYVDALAVLRGRDLLDRAPPAVCAYLEAGARGERRETPKPDDPSFGRVNATLLASNRDAIVAARASAEQRGIDVRVVSEPLRGEARDAADRLVGLGRRARIAAPTLLVAGGETSVTVTGGGIGGRNQELALAAAIALDGVAGMSLLAAGTDGRDGPTPAAGAFADPGTVARGRKAGRDAAADLAANDSHGFFSAEGGAFITGPTSTNVCDLALMVVEPPG